MRIRNANRWRRWWQFASASTGIVLLQGCTVDPDLWLRAAISVGSDTAIFFLENLAAGL